MPAFSSMNAAIVLVLGVVGSWYRALQIEVEASPEPDRS
jgi:hypothetical protein